MSLLLIELNEFNLELLKEYTLKFDLKNFKKILSFYVSETFTEDQYESDFLEPWVQWVGVHTGQPSKVHQIKHLGDVPLLHSSQLWKKLSDLGLSSGIWGAMNASREEADLCHFFLPDPWTASEKAYPDDLNPLLDLLRYTSKNYIQTSYLSLLQKGAKALRFLKQSKVLHPLTKELPHLFKTLKAFKGEAFPYISLFDYLSTLLFLKQKERYQPDFSLIFLNSLAHLQHHHWNKSDGRSDERFFYGLLYLDRCLGLLLDSLKPEDTLVMANALSQKCTIDEKPWILYRQKDQQNFLKQVGIRFEKVEAHMTHDAHIYFKNREDGLLALNVLREARVNNQALFEVETYEDQPLKLFYKIIFTDFVDQKALLHIHTRSYPFFDLFKQVVQRMGKHIQTAQVLCNQPLFSDKLFNHELFDVLIHALKAKNPALRAQIED